MIDRKFSASRFWEICRREQITAFNGMGEMLRILLKQPAGEADAANSVRMVIGAAAGAELIEQFEERFDVAVLDVYGLAETGPVTAIGWDNRRPGSCGVPTPWYEVRVFDEHDREVAPGETGQIVVRPKRPHVMMERYWGNDAATVKAWRNLWFHTGDNAHRDEDGYIWFHERGTDSIRRRGENVSAWEVEMVLAEHPSLAEATVFGVRPTWADRRSWSRPSRSRARTCRPKRCSTIARARCPTSRSPRYVRLMDKLPRSHAQRVLKHELKADGAEAPGVWDRESVGYKVRR